jgi:hypothetical protein
MNITKGETGLREWRNKTLDFVVNCACAHSMQQRLG